MDRLIEAIEATIADHPEQVERWIAARPKAWGYLAGKAVIACRVRLGRPLSEAERRIVWQCLWERIEQIKLCRQTGGSAESL